MPAFLMYFVSHIMMGISFSHEADPGTRGMFIVLHRKCHETQGSMCNDLYECLLERGYVFVLFYFLTQTISNCCLLLKEFLIHIEVVCSLAF